MNRLHATALAVAVTATMAVAGTALAAGDDQHAGRGGHPGAHHGAPPDHLTGRQRQLIRSHTKQYRDPAVAIADGYIPTDVCVEAPGLGGMGYHYVHPEYASDDVIDITKPEVLVYHDGPNGRLRLGAVEYLRADVDQDLTTDPDRPYLFDRYPFEGPMEGHEPGMPVHFDLHVWLYKSNPAGQLVGFNPSVSCPD